MTTYGLLAHELDPAKATGIARYARGLAGALDALLEAPDRAVVVTARRNGTVPSAHHVVPLRRKLVYGGWAYLGAPRVEALCRGLDLVHVTAPIVPVPTRRPLVVTVHDLLPLSHPQWYPAAEVAMFRRCVTWMEGSADLVVVPTQTVAADLRRWTAVEADRVRVTGEGVDLAHFTHDSPTSVLEEAGVEPGRFLLYLGQVSARKNLTMAIEALSPTDPVLLVVGPDGFGAAEVHAAAAARPGRVRMLGRRPDADVGTLVRSAKALVHPSLYEGFGLTVVEAMAAGTPVLVSSSGSLPEVVGDGGQVVAENSVAGWRDALSGLADPDLLARLRAAGPTRALAWSWEETARRTVACYEAALA